MSTEQDKHKDPTVYSPEAIEMLLDGSRRQIDKLLLQGLNDLTKSFVNFRDQEFRPHVEEEKILQKALGEPAEVERRRLWLDLQIAKEESCAKIRAKVLESTITKYVPVLLAALFIAAATGIIERTYDWWVYWKTVHHQSDGEK